jgi:hypothetical protein
MKTAHYYPDFFRTEPQCQRHIDAEGIPAKPALVMVLGRIWFLPCATEEYTGKLWDLVSFRHLYRHVPKEG